MGIRFACPNGHQLHVKASLAGKRGICPDCGARVMIPSAENGQASSAPAVRLDTAPAASESSVTDAAVSVSSAPDSPSDHVSPETRIGAPPVAKVPSAAGVALSSSAVWYVRPPTGGQFGPANDEALRTWIGEGRVTADCFVWRDGWAEWKLARDVYDKLPASLAAQPSSIPVAAIAATPVPTQSPVSESVQTGDAAGTYPTITGQPSAAESEAPTSSIPSYYSHRRARRRRQTTVLLWLLAAVAALACLLIWVLLRNASQTAVEPSSASHGWLRFAGCPFHPFHQDTSSLLENRGRRPLAIPKLPSCASVRFVPIVLKRHLVHPDGKRDKTA